jgi:hypothetical protein
MDSSRCYRTPLIGPERRNDQSAVYREVGTIPPLDYNEPLEPLFYVPDPVPPLVAKITVADLFWKDGVPISIKHPKGQIMGVVERIPATAKEMLDDPPKVDFMWLGGFINGYDTPIQGRPNWVINGANTPPGLPIHVKC